MSRTQQPAPELNADRPSEIPRQGRIQVLKRAWKEAKKDQIPLISAGVAFYAFLAIVPTLIAVVMIYGLVSDEPLDVANQLESFGSALPSEAEKLIEDQLLILTTSPERSLGLGLLFALGLALWSASGGIGNMIKAVNVAYDEENTRNFVKSKSLALAFTFGAIVFMVLAIALVAAVPAILAALDVPSWVDVVVGIARWLGLIVVVITALAVLYRWAPDRADAKFRWLSVGSVVATALWLLASAGFAFYVDNFGSYGRIYGSLAGVVVLLLWLWIAAYATLLGAEINAENERDDVGLGQDRGDPADTDPIDDAHRKPPGLRARVATWFASRRRE